MLSQPLTPESAYSAFQLEPLFCLSLSLHPLRGGGVGEEGDGAGGEDRAARGDAEHRLGKKAEVQADPGLKAHPVSKL